MNNHLSLADFSHRPNQIQSTRNMQPHNQAQTKEAAKDRKSRARFDPHKEQLLSSLAHQFLSRGQSHWNLLFEKLSLLQDTYKDQLALKLCRKCLCFYSFNKKAEHDETTIKSLFKDIDFKQDSVSKLLDLLKAHGRVIRNFKGEELIGFPGFNFKCGDEYYFAPDQMPPQAELQEYSFSFSIPSMTQSAETMLSKRALSLGTTVTGTDKTTAKGFSVAGKSPLKPNWRHAGKAPTREHFEQTGRSANKRA